MAHRHGPEDEGEIADTAASAPVHRVLTIAVAVVAVATVVGLVAWWPRGDGLVAPGALGFGDRVDATVTDAVITGCSYDPEARCDVVRAEITSGPDRGTSASLEFSLDGSSPAGSLDRGDEIVLNDAGFGVPEPARFSFADFQRSTPLIVLVLVFAGAVVALGRWRGLLALVGLVLTFAVLVGFVLPALLRGYPPVGVALTGASAIAFGALYLAHGLTDRTTVALLGTLASLGLTAALASVFASAARLTGLASEESINLLAFAPELDFRGLLLAAVIIGALGVLDDVTVTQVSAVWELHRSNPTMPAARLYSAAIRIGRDHIASTVNTLVLAYAAAALPLLLIFTQSGFAASQIATTETVAVEIVQTLVGSIGLVASVPITTALACWVVSHRS